MSYAILRFQKAQSGGVAGRDRHNERKKEEYKSNPNIDRSKSEQNYHLIEPSGKYKQCCMERIDDVGCRVRSNSVIMVEALITASPEIMEQLNKATSRSEQLVTLYEKLYEDNLSGKVTDEWFAQLSQKYDRERLELKAKTAEYRIRLNELELQKSSTKLFTAAIRKFMEMETLTAQLLWELIDHIDVYEAEGIGKNRTQRICICYRFVGYLEVPVPDDVLLALDIRRGVRVNYTTKAG